MLNHKDFYMPAEWDMHRAVWLSWPVNHDTWPKDGKYQAMLKPYCQLVREISKSEIVCINLASHLQDYARELLVNSGSFREDRVVFHDFATNDSWCRDHGPIFVKHKITGQIAVTNWIYNAWGGKYPPFDLDNAIPSQIAKKYNYPIFTPNIVLEGGSIEVNGKGTLLTTKACLLNPNRNPELSAVQIENYLKDYLGVTNVLWLHDGIVGDDTDGHIDDLTRFVNENTIVTIIENDSQDENYHLLKQNAEDVARFKDQDGKQFNVVELPMPKALYLDEQRLPASYANFLITNESVLVPVFEDKNDDLALSILQKNVANRTVIGINCKELVWGLGTLHCLSQQEPI